MGLDQDRLHELLHKVVGDIGGAMSAALVHVGEELGLYKALARGPQSSAELAERTQLNERMVREWLLNQAAGGYVEYDPGGEKYSMSPEQIAAFADSESPVFMHGAFDIIGAVQRDVEKLERAFRTGKGLGWGDHDKCLFCGTERFFAPSYRNYLVSEWIPAIDGMKDRLERGGICADVGCGRGSSTIFLAQAFPRSQFVGFDLHEPSVEAARRHAQEAGVKNATFEVADAVSFPTKNGGYDLVACFDCFHDLADPIGCARRVRASLADGGAWMIVEPNAADTVEENLNPIARVFSAASTSVCVPASLDGGGPALGACAGEKELRRFISEGGFSSVRRAAETPFNMVLEARV